jgi:transcriptional regulator with XRE-family HTH domain
MTGDRMKQIRGQLNLTQAQLADLVGGRKQLISDYENSRRPIPAKLGLVLVCFEEIDRLGGDIEIVARRAAQAA